MFGRTGAPPALYGAHACVPHTFTSKNKENISEYRVQKLTLKLYDKN